MSPSKPTTPEPLLVRFFDPDTAAADSRGRTLDEILSWPDQDLEQCHDYIQILFPLPEGSPFNSSAPIVTSAAREPFLARAELRYRMREGFNRMMRFYGFNTAHDSTVVCKGPDWDTAKQNWVRRFDHNHLRITRIMRSLRVLGCGEQAEALYVALLDDEVSGAVSPTTRMYWKRAARRPLHLPPDEDDEDAQGVKWLRGSVEVDNEAGGRTKE